MNSKIMFRSFVDQLESLLNMELPGEEAQFSMAPVTRKRLIDVSSENYNPKQSAVLILLFPENNSMHTILIQRGKYEGVHSGQIAFPGGKFEDGDFDLKQTALRESSEEIGIIPANINVIGCLTDVYITPSNFLVKPFIGVMNHRPDFIIDKSEVENIIPVDLFSLNDQNIRKEKSILQSGGYKIKTPYFKIEGLTVWGATAMMISELNAVVEKIKITSS
ncbi:MAG TPA: CoA pyrophosphatase [Bacteroidia bacterium]|nr:CoA pyrophosphatase [Bacteroidia bacterium]